MAASTSSHDQTSRRLVRPRWVWGGLVLALAGAIVLGVGIAMLSWWVAVVGAVLLAAGTAVGVFGGIVYDAGAHTSPAVEAEQVAHGDVHEGVAPGDTVHDPRARLEAAETTARTDAILAASRPTGPVPLAPLAGWTMLGVSALVIFTQPLFIAHSATGRASAYRDGGLVILIGLAGLRIATGYGRHLVAVGVAALAGAGLLLGGLLAAHGRTGLILLEVACGAITIVAAVAAALRPR